LHVNWVLWGSYYCTSIYVLFCMIFCLLSKCFIAFWYWSIGLVYKAGGENALAHRQMLNLWLATMSTLMWTPARICGMRWRKSCIDMLSGPLHYVLRLKLLPLCYSISNWVHVEVNEIHDWRSGFVDILLKMSGYENSPFNANIHFV
jgi:hypothetical protein